MNTIRGLLAAAAIGTAAALTASCGAPHYPYAWCNSLIGGGHTFASQIKAGSPRSLVNKVAEGQWWAAHGQSVISEQVTFTATESVTRKAARMAAAGAAADRQLARMCGVPVSQLG